MTTIIDRSNSRAEFYTDEGCFIRELSNAPDDPELSIARARVASGVTTRWHRLMGIRERYVILEGQGLVEVADDPAQEVRAGDIVHIGPGERQRIANVGPQDLIFLALCTPRFTGEAYEDAEDAPPEK